MAYSSNKIVDIYNFVETKKSRLRENIRYEVLMICEKSIESEWKCTGCAAYKILRGISSKSAELEKKNNNE